MGSRHPIIIFINAGTDKSKILKGDKGEGTGIYLWAYKESGLIYVGSAVDISKRFKDYYTPSK